MTRWIDSRSMARPVKADGRPALVQLKAIEPAYPLYGTVELQGGGARPRRSPSATACGARPSRNWDCSA